MKSIRAAVCDDEDLMLNLLSSSLEACFMQYDCKALLERFTSPAQLLEAVRQGQEYQVFFLDIDMPELNGIDLGVQLKEENEHAAIIYISNCEERVFDSFRARPLGFVRKSSFLKDLQSVVKLYIESTRNEDDRRLEIKTGQGLMYLPISEIVYIECRKDYQYFYLSKDPEPIKCRLSMGKLEDALEHEGFLRIHQGYIVNYTYIKRIDNELVELTDGTKLPMSRRKRQMVFTQYLRMSRNDRSVIMTEHS